MKFILATYTFFFLLIYQANGQTVCQIAQKPIKYIDYITQNPKLIFNSSSNPSCVLALVDSLSDHYIKTGNPESLIALESIGKISDGYLSEFYDETSQNILFGRFDGFLHYLYQQKYIYKKSSCFEFYLEVSFALDILEKRYTLSDLKNKIQKMAVKNNVSDEEKKYIIEFVNNINAQKYK
jgi:hypothetical protein